MLNFYTNILPIIFITIILFHIFNRFILIKAFENVINKHNNINSKQLNNIKYVYYCLFAIDHLLINSTIPTSFILFIYIVNNYKIKTAFFTMISFIIIISFIVYVSIIIYIYLILFYESEYHRYYNVINEFKFYKITINNIKLFIENKITNLIINKETKV